MKIYFLCGVLFVGSVSFANVIGNYWGNVEDPLSESRCSVTLSIHRSQNILKISQRSFFCRSPKLGAFSVTTQAIEATIGKNGKVFLEGKSLGTLGEFYLHIGTKEPRGVLVLYENQGAETASFQEAFLDKKGRSFSMQGRVEKME
jgi:hypothetical protein